MPEGQWRIEILCEDRRTESFLRRLCKRYEVRVLRSSTAPDGCCSAWVIANYATLVKLRRSKKNQQNLGVIAAVDGDNLGWQAREAQLDSVLDAAAMQKRASDEPVSVLCPSWCIENWLAALTGNMPATESESLKLHPDFRHLWRDPKAAAETIVSAVQAWPSGVLPSLTDAAVEAKRIGIG